MYVVAKKLVVINVAVNLQKIYILKNKVIKNQCYANTKYLLYISPKTQVNNLVRVLSYGYKPTKNNLLLLLKVKYQPHKNLTTRFINMIIQYHFINMFKIIIHLGFKFKNRKFIVLFQQI